MNKGFWGYAAIVLGVLAITIIWFFTRVTNTDQHNYTLLKETVENAMIDSIDLSAYRKDGTIRIVEAKFVENFIRRFSENANLSQVYDIEIYDINCEPPKVSLRVTTTDSTTVNGNVQTFDISNNIDAILESRYGLEDEIIEDEE